MMFDANQAISSQNLESRLVANEEMDSCFWGFCTADQHIVLAFYEGMFWGFHLG